MNICGIVCEYNPFHNGHLYHINETRARGADAIVCVMSGDFVQRGEPALLNKHYRAEMAVRCGADLVLELPTPYAISSAERFATGAISLLNSLGVVNMLSFGCEADKLDTLQKAAEILKSDAFYPRVRERMKSGVSFAVARDLELLSIAPDCAEALRSPNNLLAVEYLCALPNGVKPIAITRHGAAHDADDITDGTASASQIRKLLIGGDIDAVKPLMPDAAFKVLLRAYASGEAPAHLDSRVVLSQLKRMSKDELSRIPDVSEGLESRLYREIANASTVSELLDKVKTKRYAHSRLRRIILSAYLGITKDDLASPKYARVLALNSVGREVLARARKASSIPIITKPASAKKLAIASDFEREVLFSELYTMALPKPNCGHLEWSRSPFVL